MAIESIGGGAAGRLDRAGGEEGRGEAAEGRGAGFLSLLDALFVDLPELRDLPREDVSLFGEALREAGEADEFDMRALLGKVPGGLGGATIEAAAQEPEAELSAEARAALEQLLAAVRMGVRADARGAAGAEARAEASASQAESDRGLPQSLEAVRASLGRAWRAASPLSRSVWASCCSSGEPMVFTRRQPRPNVVRR